MHLVQRGGDRIGNRHLSFGADHRDTAGRSALAGELPVPNRSRIETCCLIPPTVLSDGINWLEKPGEGSKSPGWGEPLIVADLYYCKKSETLGDLGKC